MQKKEETIEAFDRAMKDFNFREQKRTSTVVAVKEKNLELQEALEHQERTHGQALRNHQSKHQPRRIYQF